jgi:Leucine-rich repeat (LRR) protein/GTPase SAR1 family protein
MTEDVAAIIRRARDEHATKLDLSKHELTSVPREIGQLENLSELTLNENQLTGLPEEIGQLRKLRNLDLTNNQLATLPSAILQLQNLRYLKLGRNQLAALPSEIARLQNLVHLILDNNQFSALPMEIFTMVGLSVLSIDSNLISAVPREIGELKNLRVLAASGHQHISLPEEIYQLQELRSLWLRNDGLTSVPAAIGGLKKLSQLSLSQNQLTCLPREFEQLQNLSELRLWGNAFTVLPPEMLKLNKLTYLDLNYNDLEKLPAKIGELRNLEILKLGSNKLAVLPPEIGHLRKLQVLILHGNQLTSLPQELADLPELKELQVQNNPLREPLTSLVPQGLEAVLAYLRTLPQAIKNYEAKVLMVGEGNVGKSSLVAALRAEPFVDKRDTTHGIEIGKLKIPHPQQGLEMTLNTWDFGGQEVYRITHQFFFSPRSLYLLVWKPREGREENAIEDWLRRIKLRVGDARVLIVATHADERRAELDYPYLQQRFGEILVGNFEVDSRSGRGIDQLRAAVAEQAAGLPQMGELLAPSWVGARDEILRLGKSQPQVAYSEVEEICASHGLDQPETKALLILMHIVGYVIHYGEIEGLRDVVVLQPEWLTKAISYVLEDRPTIEARGELEHARLREIWLNHRDPKRETYPPECHPYFLRLMEKFDICYRLEAEDRSLVAQLVPVERPELPWQPDSRLRPSERELAFFCKLDEDPPGLVAWLTVRNVGERSSNIRATKHCFK